MAGDTEGGEEPAVPLCPHCQQPMDDIQTMDKSGLLKEIQMGVLRGMARILRGGGSHQELSVARQLLKDNKVTAQPPDDDEADEHLPEAGKMSIPQRTFPDYDTHDD